MRIGVFGGTFDPVHLGHLLLAEACREAACLDEVRLIPSYRPPHKPGREVSRFDARLDMLALAATAQPLFKVDDIERDLPAPSYTARTLEELARRNPGASLHLIVGADCLPDFAGWYEPRAILALAELVVVPRPGVELWSRERLAESLWVPPDAVRLTTVDAPVIGLKSRELRAKLAAGRGVRFALPRAVEEYARERGLYRAAGN